MASGEVFHEGEIALQEQAGERSEAVRNGAMIAGSLHPAMRAFLGQQRLLALGVSDATGRPSARLLFGAPGLATSQDGREVTLDLSRLAGPGMEPTLSSLVPGASLALLAIDLGSRRRLRVNGAVASRSKGAVAVAVAEVFPNCPKYIQRRRLVEAGGSPVDTSVARGTGLDGARREAVGRADTLFVASRHPSRGHDVSHRGGAPGFVQVLDDRTLRIPDYPGNGMFQTLGNLAVSGEAGLLLPDFERGRVLRLAGTVSLRFDLPENPARPTGGTGRAWDFQVTDWVDAPAPTAFRWELLETSPFNPTPADGPPPR